MEIRGTISDELLTMINNLCNLHMLDKESTTYNQLTDKEKKIINILYDETGGGCFSNLSKVDILLNVLLFMRTGEFIGAKITDNIKLEGIEYHIYGLVDPQKSCATEYRAILLPDNFQDWGWENQLFNLSKDYFMPFVDVWLYKQALKEHDNKVLKCVSDKIHAKLGDKEYEIFQERIIRAAELEVSVQEWEDVEVKE
ncbi:MAG: hypothetical protein BZ138_07985 [Methanosphaera sp. rholeuAM270]|nr:MAG: hypothetical protein BZ138_07985 [Methanosphaera sp. rholeuAM270]